MLEDIAPPRADALAFTPYHSQYLAHRITLAGVSEDAFAKSLSTAKVDMTRIRSTRPFSRSGPHCRRA